MTASVIRFGSQGSDLNSPAPGGRRYLAALSLGALGVVYGDIGTSPLYAFRESFHAGNLPVTESAVLGVVSTMVWALVVVVTIKYLALVMRADNHGEGGILALTALVSPVSRLGKPMRAPLIVLLGLFGTALLYGDGAITPAISVLAAVEGIQVAAPALEPWVVPVSVAILIGLFAVQHQGTTAIGRVFGPVMVVWFLTLAGLGLLQVAGQPSVLRALDPSYAVQLFMSAPRSSFFALGAIFLVVTGAEALYADMGHFGVRPIRLGWFTIVFPALVLNYLGQAALLLADPAAIDNPFYRMAPSTLVIPLITLATAATVIASQALITGAFSLTAQAIQLGFLPRLKVDHTSPREIGQVYVPFVNFALMVACIGLVVGFGSSTNLAAAYGIAVTTTMLITTVLLFQVAVRRWGWRTWQAAIVMTLFAVVDLGFFGANVLKIAAGGWVPIAIAAVVFGAMLVWSDGRARLSMKLGEHDRIPIERFIGSIAEHPQTRVRGTAVYLTRDAGSPPGALLQNLRANEVLHEIVLLVEVRTADVPRVLPAARAAVHELGEGFIQVRLTYGFMEQPNVPQALSAIVAGGFGFDPTDAIYVVGRESLVAEAPGARGLVAATYRFLHRNATRASDFFQLPTDQVIELGAQVSV